MRSANPYFTSFLALIVLIAGIAVAARISFSRSRVATVAPPKSEGPPRTKPRPARRLPAAQTA